MASHRHFCLFVVLLTALICSSHAYRFIVGGKDGWVLNPTENYNHWAERMRFQVNDTLFFKYKKGSDSVLVVSKDDYKKCNIEKPIMKMEDGDSVFKFDRSGPFFFISGMNGSCEKGQKLIIIVLAVRKQKRSPPRASTPAPVGQTPSAAPPSGSTYVSPSPTPAMTPVSPSPVAMTPALSPSPSTSPLSPSPVAKQPAMSPTPAMGPTSPSPVSHSPVPSSTPAMSPNSPSPSAMTPVVSPAPAITPESPSPANSPAVSSPSPSPSPSPANSPAVSPAPASAFSSPSPTASLPPTSPTNVTPSPSPSTSGADIHAPASARSSSAAFTPSIVLLWSISLALSVSLGSFITAPYKEHQ